VITSLTDKQKKRNDATFYKSENFIVGQPTNIVGGTTIFCETVFPTQNGKHCWGWGSELCVCLCLFDREGDSRDFLLNKTPLLFSGNS